MHEIVSSVCRRRGVNQPESTRLRRDKSGLAAGDGPDDEKGLFPRCDGIGKRGIRRLKRIVFLAGEEPQERTALLRDMIADRAAQHRILGLEGVEPRALCDGTL